jgi:hypothetical protein
VLTQPLGPGRHVLEVYDACLVFGATANPSVCPNNQPPRVCLNAEVAEVEKL